MNKLSQDPELSALLAARDIILDPTIKSVCSSREAGKSLPVGALMGDDHQVVGFAKASHGEVFAVLYAPHRIAERDVLVTMKV